MKHHIVEEILQKGFLTIKKNYPKFNQIDNSVAFYFWPHHIVLICDFDSYYLKILICGIEMHIGLGNKELNFRSGYFI